MSLGVPFLEDNPTLWEIQIPVQIFKIVRLELQTSSFKWLFHLDDSKSLHEKWVFHHLNIGCLGFQE